MWWGKEIQLTSQLLRTNSPLHSTDTNIYVVGENEIPIYTLKINASK